MGKLLTSLFSVFTRKIIELNIKFYFIMSDVGKEYGIGHIQKLKLVRKITQKNKKITALSTWFQHLLLVEEIFSVPKSLKGDVVECGCYNGASTISLSLACALTKRRLFVCDSFEGLPTPKEDEKHTVFAHRKDYYAWEEGELSSKGGLEAVKKNIEKFGSIEVCQFVKGFFKDTLKDIKTNSIVLIFEDADLASSVEDCLRYLWPKLLEGCKYYCHEPAFVDVISLFYNNKWWKDNLNTLPPGFYGSGIGIEFYRGIGYAKKIDVNKIKKYGQVIGQKNIVAKTDIPKGSKITRDKVKFLRSDEEKGIPPDKFEEIEGKIAKKDIKKYHNLTYDDF